MRLCLMLALLLAGCAPALKDVKPTLAAADAGTVWFTTTGSIVRTTPTTLTVEASSTVISGELVFPPGRGPFPTVVLAHGCGGVGNADAAWALALREWGYATFVLDSFRGRGLREVCTNALMLTGTQRIPDAYGALRILVTHPRIDSRRIALMGFSHGGILTIGASTVWAKKTFGRARQEFRAFLPFYPYCNTDYPERHTLSAPLRIHSGELDDWTPAKPCAQLVEKLRSSGQDASITLYAGAHHSFDNLGASSGYLPNVQSYAACFFRGPSVLGPFSGANPAECIRRGATISFNAEATKRARSNVRAQLAEILR